MEIKLIPNWTSPAQGYIEVAGTFNSYQLNNPNPGDFWFYSSVQFREGAVIRITQATAGSYLAIVKSVSSFLGLWSIIVQPTSGSADLSAITKIEEPYYDEGAFYLDGAINLLLNFRIFDLKELKRSSTFTKTIDVPFSKNNDKVFTQIFNINVVDGFNPKKKSDCIITDGGILISSGYLQVQEIDLDNKLYKCVFYGENKNLFDDIGDKVIFGNSDRSLNLNFDDVVHNKTKAEVDASWANQRDFVYAHVKTNNNTITVPEITQTGIPSEKLYLHLRAKYIIDRIFQKYGYQYESNFFETDSFKQLLVLPSLEKPTGSEFVEYQSTAYAGNEIPQGTYFKVTFQNQVLDEYSTSYNSGTGRFIIPTKDRYTISCGFAFEWAWGYYSGSNSFTQAQNAAGEVRLVMRVYRRGILIGNNITIAKESEFAEQNNLNQSVVYGVEQFECNHVPLPFNFDANDEVEFYFYVPKTGIKERVGDLTPPANYYTQGPAVARKDSFLPWLAIENETFQSNPLPMYMNIKQVDILGDIIKMFNLYIKPDKNNARKFKIEPRDDFYRSGKIITDLNYDVTSVQISYLNDLAAKKYIFTYASDTDLANKTFQDNNKNRVYGDAQIELDNDFLNNEKKVQLVGAPTQYINIARNWVAPSIQNEDSVKPTTSFKTRYLYYAGLQDFRGALGGTNSATFSVNFKLNNTPTQSQVYTYAKFPGTSNFINYENTNTESLLFAVNGGSNVKESSLYYNYYENEIETYADPASHILTLDVELNTKILAGIDFNDLYYFEINGNPQYYTLLSIENYDPTQTTMATMKFLTYYDYRSNKPKRSRFFPDTGYVNAVGTGDITNIKDGIGDIRPADNGGGIRGGGSNVGDIGGVKNGIFVGDGNVFKSGNEGILLIGDGNIFGDNVKKTFVFGDNNNINADGVFTFGSNGTYSTPNKFAFGDLDPVMSKKDINSVTQSEIGALYWGGTASGLNIWTGTTFSYIGGGSSGVSGSNGSSGSSGSDGSAGTSGTSGTSGSDAVFGYTYSVDTNTSYTTFSVWIEALSVVPDQEGTGIVSYFLKLSVGSGGDTPPDINFRVTTDGTIINEFSQTQLASDYYFYSNTLYTSWTGGQKVAVEYNAPLGSKVDAGSNMSVIKLKNN